MSVAAAAAAVSEANLFVAEFRCPVLSCASSHPRPSSWQIGHRRQTMAANFPEAKERRMRIVIVWLVIVVKSKCA